MLGHRLDATQYAGEAIAPLWLCRWWGIRQRLLVGTLSLALIFFWVAIPAKAGDGVTIPPRDSVLTVMAVGDIMLGTSYPSGHLPPNDDADALLATVASILRRGDVTFGNLEGAFLESGKPYKQCRDASSCYVFRMPPRYAPALQRAGFNMLSLANNHVGDFGPPAQRCTMQLLDSLSIRHAGLVSCPTDTLTVKGIRVGLCAFAPNSGTCQLNDYATLRRTVTELKKTCDIVIASCHMGGEGAKHTHVTKAKELHLGENRGNPHEIARTLIDAGADIVLGHGPHVSRAIDLYKGRFIAYSLGNFCTYGRFNLKGVCGLAPIIELQVTNRGEFVAGQIHATEQRGRGGVSLDKEGKVIREIIALTREDLGDNDLTISEEGRVTPSKK